MFLESSRSFPEQLWDAVIWHNGHDSREWRELVLNEQPEAIGPVIQRVYYDYRTLLLTWNSLPSAHRKEQVSIVDTFPLPLKTVPILKVLSNSH